jgi:hypothetical protein
MVGYQTRVTSVAIVGLLLLASEAASQPPTIPEPPLVIEGRVLGLTLAARRWRWHLPTTPRPLRSTFTAFVRATITGSGGTSTSESSGTFYGQAVGSRHSRFTW